MSLKNSYFLINVICFEHEAWEKGPVAQSQSIYFFIHIFGLVLPLI